MGGSENLTYSISLVVAKSQKFQKINNQRQRSVNLTFFLGRVWGSENLTYSISLVHLFFFRTLRCDSKILIVDDEDFDSRLCIRRNVTIMLLKKGGAIAAGSLNYEAVNLQGDQSKCILHHTHINNNNNKLTQHNICSITSQGASKI